ncbi:nitroreductase [Polycladomyces sp. WAk]|uniref:Putative NAD(P)H nitroreductase n=1 Tax=Polycladomyces zharkentensis TaxID=2807616 RepID=A0ABS2WHN9_9BACL|nr:nitroreductase [Polycladomyces sp. WAk]MBN2909031.1 nitroreductase [Polycladomyces sp. WAk]
MDIWTAIRTRRSIGVMKPDPVPRKMIEQLLEAAVWAPCHHMTEPWRFFVLTDEGRRPLARTLVEIAREKMTDPDTDENRAKLAKEEQKPFRAPVVIAVAVSPSDDPKVEMVEELAAVHAAVQNMLLAARAMGLGAIWRTGMPCYHPKMKELFGLGEKEQLVGFVYVGYPAIDAPVKKRTPASEKTRWIDKDGPYHK